jgi:hypothetical protein
MDQNSSDALISRANASIRKAERLRQEVQESLRRARETTAALRGAIQMDQNGPYPVLPNRRLLEPSSADG